MKSYQEFVNEAKSPYPVYHDSYTSAIQAVETFVGKRGYILDPDEMFRVVGSGPGKPSPGKTNKFHIFLYKNEKDLDNQKAQKKLVHVQIYGLGSGLSSENYELNAYIA